MAVDDRAAGRLGEIAAVIGCHVEVFYLPDSEAHEAGMTCELLQLWNTITEPQARQRILDSARQEVRAISGTEILE